MGERISLFWRFQLTGWAVFIAVTFPLKIMLAGSVTGALMLCVVRDGSSFLLTLGIRQIYRKFWSNEIGRMVALIAVTCVVAGLLQNGFVVLFRSFVSSEAEFHLTHSKAFDVFYERTGLLFGWSFLYFGIRHAIEGIQRDLRLALIESEKHQAQLQMLRSQMNPHFLFNALNSIQVNVEKVNADLGRMVQSLADLLRFSLDHSQYLYSVRLIPGREARGGQAWEVIWEQSQRVDDDEVEFIVDMDKKVTQQPRG